VERNLIGNCTVCAPHAIWNRPPSLDPGDCDVQPTEVAAMSIRRRQVATALAALLTFAAPFAAMAEPVRNVVLVHGAWVDGSGWRAVHDILVSKGFRVTEVQEPETSFAADVAATRRILDLQDGPTLLVGHSYGGSVVTEAGVHSKVVGLVYVAAHAPDVGEDEATLGKRTPSGLARTPGAIARTPDGYTYLTPSAFPTLFAPDLSRQQAEFEASSQVPAAAEVFTTPLTAAAWRTKPSWGIVAGSDQIINPELERFYYQRAGSHMTVIKGASHSVYQSHAAEVAAVIESAARQVGSGN
jgi:pimeloyl-ACP methyl ester carboxylesterase